MSVNLENHKIHGHENSCWMTLIMNFIKSLDSVPWIEFQQTKCPKSWPWIRPIRITHLDHEFFLTYRFSVMNWVSAHKVPKIMAMNFRTKPSRPWIVSWFVDSVSWIEFQHTKSQKSWPRYVDNSHLGHGHFKPS